MVNTTVRIGDSLVGVGHPAYVIAEGGVNHNGSADLAHHLVDVAGDARANAIKFQTFNPSSLVTMGAKTAEYQQRETGMSDQFQMLSELCLPPEALVELKNHANDRGLEFLSTPFDAGSLASLVDLGVNAIKISSGDLTNRALLREARATELPLILSTGASFLQEVSAAVETLGGVDGIIMLHCVTAYPSPIGHSNLRAIPSLAREFPCPVGWSDHSIGATTAIAAVGLGATIFEKHITTDAELPGPDHKASAEPEAFAEYVAAIREAEAALGDGVKVPQASETANRSVARRSFYAARNLPADTVLAEADLLVLRPEAGMPASTEVAGQTLTRALEKGEPLQAQDVRQ